MENQELYISEGDNQKIDDLLKSLVKTTGSRCGLLVDKSGHLIQAKGHFHFIPPDDMGVMAAGAFSALCNMVDIAAAHLTTSFHFEGAETLHFAMVTPQIFLLIVFQCEDIERAQKCAAIMKNCQDFVSEVKPILANKSVKPKEWGSMDFINKKINEIFDTE